MSQNNEKCDAHVFDQLVVEPFFYYVKSESRYDFYVGEAKLIGSLDLNECILKIFKGVRVEYCYIPDMLDVDDFIKIFGESKQMHIDNRSEFLDLYEESEIIYICMTLIKYSYLKEYNCISVKEYFEYARDEILEKYVKRYMNIGKLGYIFEDDEGRFELCECCIDHTKIIKSKYIRLYMCWDEGGPIEDKLKAYEVEDATYEIENLDNIIDYFTNCNDLSNYFLLTEKAREKAEKFVDWLNANYKNCTLELATTERK